MSGRKQTPRRKKFNEQLYSQLLAATLPGVIETEEENEHQLEVVKMLMDRAPRGPEEDRLMRLLVLLIGEYERRTYQPEEATPLEVLHELMASNELRPRDLLPIFKHWSTLSQVLKGKRPISAAAAQGLAKFFHTSADLFLKQ